MSHKRQELRRRRTLIDPDEVNTPLNTNTNTRHAEIDKLKRKGFVGAILSLFILQFNAFAIKRAVVVFPIPRIPVSK